MSEAFALSPDFNSAESRAEVPRSLGLARRGDRGVIVKVTGVSGAAEAIDCDPEPAQPSSRTRSGKKAGSARRNSTPT